MTRPFLLRWGWPRPMHLLLALLLAGGANAQVTSLDAQSEPAMTQTDPGGPVPLRATGTATTSERTPARAGTATGRRGPGQDQDQFQERDVYVPGEFERFVQRLAGPPSPGTPQVRRFGAELITGGLDARGTDVEPAASFESRGAELSPVAPGDYIVAPGDEILLTLWGSVDADLRLTVDRGGRISVPRVGAIQVAGVRNADLPAVVERRVAQVFKNFQLSVSLGQLRGVRIFVTGFVSRPGTYTVSALSTVVGALMRAGGPSSAGSFRQVELKRGGALVARFDLYDLLLRGDRSADLIVQSGDVVHVSAVGTQVGLIGSVNQAAVFEVKPGETVADLLAMAGGFSAVADRSRLSVERLDDRSNVRIRELRLPADSAAALASGDVLRAFSAVEANQPIERQNKRVVIEGEVLRPGEYVLPPASSIADAVRAAGGLTSAAFVFGTEFTRESVRRSQQVNYDRALRNLETDFTRASATQRTLTSEEAAAQQARSASTARLIANLRAVRPTGRVVLQLPPEGGELPDLALEDGDRLHIPARGTTVGVFGSVFNSGSYLFTDGRSVDEFLSLAGGPTSGADPGSVFVIRANGSVVSARQGQRWFNTDNRLAGLPAQPGDTIFVPEEMDKTTFMQHAKDWTQILAQFALGVAAIQVLGN
jgi:protein involved in polysaccharide export with SLBB domain